MFVLKPGFRVMIWLATLILVVTSVGCATTDSAMREAGNSEGYITGFHDGRHSGMKEAGNYLEHMVKDIRRFESEADYREGWLAGEQEGKRMQQQADAAVGSTAGYEITRDAEKSVDQQIEKAGKAATKNVDTESLKILK